MTVRFDRLLGEVGALRDVGVWEVIPLLSRAAKLKDVERTLAAVAIARVLIRQKRLLDFAAELLDASAAGPSHVVLDGQAQLADLRGDHGKASALRALAATAPDAPSATEELRNEWVSQEMKWRKKDATPDARRKRLDAYFKARKSLT